MKTTALRTTFTALLVISASCRDLPNMPLEPPSGPAHRSVSAAPPQWTAYFRSDTSLFVYDKSIEIGMITPNVGEYQTVQNLNMSIVASSVYWNDYINNAYPSGPNYSEPYADYVRDMASRAQQLGLDLAFVFNNDGNCDTSWDPCIRTDRYSVNTVHAKFASFVRQVADTIRAFPVSHLYFIIWNEPDAGWGNGLLASALGQCPNRYADGQSYADMLRQTHDTLLAHGYSNIWILTAGLTGNEKFTDSGCQHIDYSQPTSWDFMNGMYAAGGGRYFDFLAVHGYGYSVSDPIQGFHAKSLSIANQVSSVDPGRPIWMTETGMSANNAANGGTNLPSPLYDSTWDARDTGFFDTTQHTYIDDAWHTYIWDGVLAKMVLYSLNGGGYGCEVYDNSGNILYGPTSAQPNRNEPRCQDQQFGIIRTTDGSPRPAYNLLYDLEHWQGDFINSHNYQATGRSAYITLSRGDRFPLDLPWHFESSGLVTLDSVLVRPRVPTVVRVAPPTVTISGPTSIAAPGTYTWTASPPQDDGSYTYTWLRSDDGGAYYVAGSGQSLTLSLYYSSPANIDLRVAAYSATRGNRGGMLHVSFTGNQY